MVFVRLEGKKLGLPSFGVDNVVSVDSILAKTWNLRLVWNRKPKLSAPHI